MKSPHPNSALGRARAQAQVDTARVTRIRALYDILGTALTAGDTPAAASHALQLQQEILQAASISSADFVFLWTELAKQDLAKQDQEAQ